MWSQGRVCPQRREDVRPGGAPWTTSALLPRLACGTCGCTATGPVLRVTLLERSPKWWSAPESGAGTRTFNLADRSTQKTELRILPPVNQIRRCSTGMEQTTAIVHGLLMDGTVAPPVPEGTVLVRGGRKIDPDAELLMPTIG